MNKNKKFQKEQLKTQGFENFKEFYKKSVKIGGKVMAESMQGLHRSHRCTEVSNKKYW